MHASLPRRQLGGLVPPKIAAPSLLVSGQGADLSPLVNFYSKLPKGPQAAPLSRGLKARYFSGKNASAAPLVVGVLAIVGFGYTIDYQSAPFSLLPSPPTPSPSFSLVCEVCADGTAFFASFFLFFFDSARLGVWGGAGIGCWIWTRTSYSASQCVFLSFFSSRARACAGRGRQG
ncbi:mitochondrial F1-F0 ATP synthase subunit F of fungi-domain-containing protein [Amylostereum chailletii]|nr:mitochondrial F1-F0 ATP synthase subunit F of fungi-domain-containing protein [Amylostereum chailletii]